VSTGARSSSASRGAAERLLAAGRNLYLAGFMATGKTATARAVARTLGAPWLDLDREIEREAGMSVAEIFEKRGERVFRAAEHRALRAAVAAGGRVVALGGGAVCFERNRALLRGTGPVVLLTAPPEVIMRRVGRSGTRPLLRGADAPARLRALLARRSRDYRRYRLRVDTSELTPAGAAEAVLHVVEAAGRRAETARARDMAARRGGTCR
jgi:shikimate kinase